MLESEMSLVKKESVRHKTNPLMSHLDEELIQMR